MTRFNSERSGPAIGVLGGAIGAAFNQLVLSLRRVRQRCAGCAPADEVGGRFATSCRVGIEAAQILTIALLSTSFSLLTDVAIATDRR